MPIFIIGKQTRGIHMQVEAIGSNMTQVETENYIILVSYKTVVAYENKQTGELFRTDKKWSTTTSKHINKWLDGRFAYGIPQEALDKIL
jgi:hypothetical protein